MQGKVDKRRKKRAFTPAYVPPSQMVIPGFEFPHEHEFDKDNRWIKLAELIPWDRIVSQYMSCFHSKEGRRPINGRIIIGSIIIKHVLNLTDRETIQTIRENSYLQYFLGYQGFTSEPPFSAPLFVSIRKRLTAELLEKINGIIIEHAGISQKRQPVDPPDSPPKDGDPGSSGEPGSSCQTSPSPKAKKEVTHKGKLLMEARVAPQNIAYPTDLKLLQ